MRSERVAVGLYVFGLVVLCCARLLPFAETARLAWLGAIIAGVGFAPLLLGRSSPEKAVVRVLVAASSGACLALLLQPPLFSDDIWRYAVDASVTHAGIHPFAYAPDSPKLAGIADAQRALANHPHMRTIYPPGAQAWFALWHPPGAAGVLGLRVGAVVAAAVAAWMLRGRAAGEQGGLPPAVALWAHPLVLVAVGGNGHLDALALPLITGWCLAIRGGRLRVAALVAAAGVAVKLVPALLWAASVPRFGRRAALWGGVGALVAALCWAGSVELGTKSLGSLGVYASRWSYNASIAWGIEQATHAAFELRFGADSVRLASDSWLAGLPGLAIRAEGVDLGIWLNRWQVAAATSRAVALLGLAAVGWLALRRRPAPEQVAIWLLVTLFLTSPVVHPWYLLWLLPLAVWTGARAISIWSLTVLLAFYTPAAVLDGEPWAESLLLRCIQYVPVFGAIVFAWSTSRRTAALTGQAGAP